MTQLPLGLTAKARGRERVEATHPEFVPQMRVVAKWISREQGEVHIDHLRFEARRLGIRPRHPNAWGCIFKGPGWKKVGERASEWPSNHAHVSPIWRWIGP